MAKTLFQIELLSNQLIIVSSYIYLGMTVFDTHTRTYFKMAKRFHFLSVRKVEPKDFQGPFLNLRFCDSVIQFSATKFNNKNKNGNFFFSIQKL